MTTISESQCKAARVAGILYLLIAISAPFALIYIPSKLIVPGDATATADRFQASESLVRVGIGFELFHQALAIFLVLALYRLFKAVDEKHAVLMVILGALVSVPIVFLNVLNEVAALILVSDADVLSVLGKPQRDTLAYLFVRLHEQGLIIASIFLGALVISTWNACPPIRVHPPRIGRLVDGRRNWLSGQFRYLPGPAGVRGCCWSVRGGSLLWGTAVHILALDMGYQASAIHRASRRVGGWVAGRRSGR